MNLTKIYPRIKSTPSTTMTGKSISVNITLDENSTPIYKEIGDGISLFFVIENNHRFELIQNRHLKEHGISFETVLNQALKNLDDNVLGKTKAQGDEKELIMVMNGGNYEAAIILIDLFWIQIKSFINAEVCFAIPCPDILLIAPKNSDIGRLKMKEMIIYYFDNSEPTGLITKNIYEPVNGEFILIDKV